MPGSRRTSGTSRVELLGRPQGSPALRLAAVAVADESAGRRTISADGRCVILAGFAEGLAGSETRVAQVYRRDTLTGEFVLVSRVSGGAPGSADSDVTSISADGGEPAAGARWARPRRGVRALTHDRWPHRSPGLRAGRQRAPEPSRVPVGERQRVVRRMHDPARAGRPAARLRAGPGDTGPGHADRASGVPGGHAGAGAHGVAAPSRGGAHRCALPFHRQHECGGAHLAAAATGGAEGREGVSSRHVGESFAPGLRSFRSADDDHPGVDAAGREQHPVHGPSGYEAPGSRSLPGAAPRRELGRRLGPRGPSIPRRAAAATAA